MRIYRLAIYCAAFTFLLAGISSAFARNDKLVLPIGEVTKSSKNKAIYGSDIQLKFGHANSAVLSILGQATEEGIGRAENRSEQLEDEPRCRHAMTDALAKLTAKARQSGATAVVEIVSAYGGIEYASPVSYECHAGASKAVVVLKGVFVKDLPAAYSQLQPQTTSAEVAARRTRAQFFIQVPAALDPAATMPEAVKRECGVELLVGNHVFEEVHKRVQTAKPIADITEAGSNKVLTLTILNVHGWGGGGYTGAKAISIRADVVLNAEVIATTVLKRSSSGGAFGGMAGTCPILERVAIALGKDVANWLPAEVTNAVASGVPTAAPSLPAKVPTSTVLEHRKQVPAATAYATFDDLDAVPLRPEGKERYKHFLTLPSPKAFIIYPNGGWRFWWKSPDAMTNALDSCERDGKTCWLYAVDDRVVWSTDIEKRISKSAQLQDR